MGVSEKTMHQIQKDLKDNADAAKKASEEAAAAEIEPIKQTEIKWFYLFKIIYSLIQ